MTSRRENRRIQRQLRRDYRLTPDGNTRMAAAITALSIWGIGVVCGLLWAELQKGGL
jgi:hypothetical protein